MYPAIHWFAYVICAFIVMPGLFRLRFGRWPFVVPVRWTGYTCIEAAFAIACLAYTIALLGGADPSPLSVPAGVALLLAAMTLQAWAVAAMGPHWRIGFDPQRDRCSLVRRGPFPHLRHPIYWSLFGVALSQVFLIGVNWQTILMLLPTSAYFVIQGNAENQYWYGSGEREST